MLARSSNVANQFLEFKVEQKMAISQLSNIFPLFGWKKVEQTAKFDREVSELAVQLNVHKIDHWICWIHIV